MSGGVVSLVAIGPQDTWLTGKPEVSFYRSNYRRFTHYANSVERQVIQGQPIANGISTIRFEKKGDLLSYVYLTARDSNGATMSGLDWTKVIDKVELYIGGQVVDTQDIEFMTDIEPITGARTFSERYLNNTSSTFNNQKTAFLPLKFFFCKDWSVALPLIGLQFHDVEIRITWSSFLSNTITIGPTTTGTLPSPNSYEVLTNLTTLTGSATVTTASLTLTTVNGPISSGMIVSYPGATLSNLLVIASLEPASTSNTSLTINVNFPVNTSATIAASASLVSYVPSAFASSTIPSFTSSASSATITLSNVIGAVSLGQFVVGSPYPGPVVVTAVSGSTVTVSFTAGSSLTSGTLTVIAFIPGASVNSTTYTQLQYTTWANFIYLDQTERDWFAKERQDLLITQVQRVMLGTNPVQELALAQPVKYIAFPCVNYTQLYANGANSLAVSKYQFKTQVNGVDVGDSRHLPHWVDVPQYYNTPYGYSHNNTTANVAIISYCLDTSKLQPTGTLNFSRLDTFRIITPSTLVGGVGALGNSAINYPVVYFYAVNYNIFRIQNGLGSVLYAN